MRTLKFIVDGQTIKKDPSCDFEGLVPGTDKYLTVEFVFSPSWNQCVKAARFYSPLGKEYKPCVLSDGRKCVVPTEALTKRAFKVQVQGVGHNYTLTTNKVTVSQNGG